VRASAAKRKRRSSGKSWQPKRPARNPGHLGETIPFLLWRFDSRTGPDFYAVKLAKRPSQYVKENVVVATSGMCSAEPLNCTINALGYDRVMFAADYPFESVEEAGHFIDNVPLEEKVRQAICSETAARVLKLPRG
jgi:2,3-dihydroxybenzoate decarboxylase